MTANDAGTTATLHFPLLADVEPKGEVARRCGVYRDAKRERDHVRGPADAPVTLVECGDDQCRRLTPAPVVVSRPGRRTPRGCRRGL